MSLSIDHEIARVMSVILQKANELEALIQEIRDEEKSVHAGYIDFDISVRYLGDPGEWFAATAWTGDWFEVVHGEERAKQLELRAKSD